MAEFRLRALQRSPLRGIHTFHQQPTGKANDKY